MPRRRLLALGAVAAVALAVALVVVLAGGGRDSRGPAVRDPLGAALAYVSPAAPVVAELDVAPSDEQGRAARRLAQVSPLARFGAEMVRSGLSSAGLDPDRDLPRLLGGPVVVAGPPAAFAALTASARTTRLEIGAALRAGAVVTVSGAHRDDARAALTAAAAAGRLRRFGPATYALAGRATGVAVVDGPVAVLAATPARARASIALRRAARGLTRTAFVRRLGPLAARPALLRAAVPPRLLLAPIAARVPWVQALRGGALSLALTPRGLRVRLHLATDPARLRPQDLPLAPGARPPAPAPGRAPLHAAVRDLSQTLRFVEATRGTLRVSALASLQSWLAAIDRYRLPLRLLGIDPDPVLVNQLTGTTTFTREPGGWAMRAELRDGRPLHTALTRLAVIPDVLLHLAHLTDLNVARSGADAFVITRRGAPVLRAAVLNDVLVATTDPRAGLRAIARRRAARPASLRPGATTGALSFHLAGPAARDAIVRRLRLPPAARLYLAELGDLDGAARATPSGLDVDATLRLAQ